MFEQENNNYVLSSDYDLLKELLEAGQVFGIVESSFIEDSLVLDPVLIRKKGSDSYMVAVRGTCYLDAWPASGGWVTFLEQAEKYKLQFVVPDKQLAEDLRLAEDNYRACSAARTAILRTVEMYKDDEKHNVETIQRLSDENEQLRTQLDECRRDLNLLK